MKRITNNSRQAVALLGLAGIAAVPALIVAPTAARAETYVTRYGDVIQLDRDDDHAVFVGHVDKVKGRHEFNLKSEGYLYNVYTNDDLPPDLDKHDRVRVRGDRVGHNDIRNAHVEILEDR